MVNFKISARELRAKKERNFEERLKFIDLWVDYIKKTPDTVWSAQQKEIIDSQIRGNYGYKLQTIPKIGLRKSRTLHRISA